MPTQIGLQMAIIIIMNNMPELGTEYYIVTHSIALPIRMQYQRRRMFTNLGPHSPPDEVLPHEQQRLSVSMQLRVTNINEP